MWRFALLLLIGLWGCDPTTEATGDAAPDPEPGVAPDPAPGPAPGPEPDDCVSTADFYLDRVYAPVFATTCVACHVADGVAGDTRLRLQGPADVDADLAALAILAAEEHRGTPTLLLKPSAAHPDGHGGGMVLSIGAQGYRDLAHLADRLTDRRDACGVPRDPDDPGVEPPDAPTDCVAPPPGLRGLRRLSHVEYANTVRDVLGVDFDAEDAFTPDRVVHGFDNSAGALTVTALLADQQRTAAELIGAQVAVAPLVDCAPSSACARATVREVGGRLFRRPLTDDEVDRYLEIHTLAATDGFDAGVRWVVTAMLQSPHFLYRTELGRRVADGFALTSYEIAAELSYLFWQTAPDDELRARAADGQLLDAAEIAAQAERLLANPRSAAVMARFSDQWLDIGDLAVVSRDAAVYPELTPALRAEMAEETRRFITTLWRSGGGLTELFSASERVMTPALAAHYAIDGPNDGWGAVDLTGTPYGGILSHGSVLTRHALPANSSPIHRGIMVRERMLCQELPDPPANLDTSPPPVDPGLSTRDRYSQHASDVACSGCHRLIDPIGFAFEHFDGIGRYRERDGVHPIDASGRIVQAVGDDIPVDGLAALSAALAENDAVRDCYVTHWVRYGFGVDDTLPMGCYVNHLGRDLAALSDVLPAMAATAHFRLRIGGESEEDVPGAALVPTEPGEIVDPPMEPDPMPEPEPGPVGGAVLEVREASRWDTGYCADGIVTNPTDADVVWQVVHPVEGTINNLWNASRDADSGRVTFTGLDWNGTLGPGQSADFGWCAQL